jgi:hypothetical protein
VACLVTVEEHKLLSAQKGVSGWDRYRDAGIVVYDMEPDPRVEYRPWEIGSEQSEVGAVGRHGSLTPAEFIDAWLRNRDG